MECVNLWKKPDATSDAKHAIIQEDFPSSEIDTIYVSCFPVVNLYESAASHIFNLSQTSSDTIVGISDSLFLHRQQNHLALVK